MAVALTFRRASPFQFSTDRNNRQQVSSYFWQLRSAGCVLTALLQCSCRVGSLSRYILLENEQDSLLICCLSFRCAQSECAKF